MRKLKIVGLLALVGFGVLAVQSSIEVKRRFANHRPPAKLLTEEIAENQRWIRASPQPLMVVSRLSGG